MTLTRQATLRIPKCSKGFWWKAERLLRHARLPGGVATEFRSLMEM